MPITRSQIPILAVNIIFLIFFGMLFLSRGNFEFVIYVGVIVSVMAILLSTNNRVQYSNSLLWCLTIWSFLHMAGGGLTYNGAIWYQQILLPISDFYQILRYDQVVHAFGFFTATILSYQLLKGSLGEKKIGFGLGLVLVMAGAGFGAFNEVVEFFVDQSLPASGVGGYVNTSLDLISNFVGAIIAVVSLQLFPSLRN